MLGNMVTFNTVNFTNVMNSTNMNTETLSLNIHTILSCEHLDS